MFEAVDMPCPGPFFFHSVHMTFVLSLTQMLVLLSLYAMLSILLSFWSARPQVCSVLVWSVSGLCTICHSWQHTGAVHLSLQADGKVAFEDIPGPHS